MKRARIMLSVAAACVMLSGCTLPGENAKQSSEDDNVYYTTVPNEAIAVNEVVNYSWALKPSFDCDNIITPDGSLFDPNNIKSKAYMYVSIVCQEGKFGFVDLNGSMVVYPEYSNYHILPTGEMALSNKDEEGNISVCTLDDYLRKQETVTSEDKFFKYYWNDADKKIYVENETGEARLYTGSDTVVVCKANATQSEEGVFYISNIDKSAYALADQDGLMTDFEYEDYYAPTFYSTSETCIALKKDGQWGYSDESGNMVLDFKFNPVASAYSNNEANSDETIHPFLYSEGYVAVANEKGFGYYTKDGSVLIPTGTFRQARPIHNSRAWVNVDGLWGIIKLDDAAEIKIPKITTTTTTTTATVSYYTSSSTAAPTTTPSPSTTPAPETTVAPVPETTPEVTEAPVPVTEDTTPAPVETAPPQDAPAEQEVQQ